MAVFVLLGYLLLAWLGLLLAPLFGQGVSILQLLDRIPQILDNPFQITLCPQTPRVLAVFLLLYTTVLFYLRATRRNTRPGVEHGSASWGDAKSLATRYMDKNGPNLLLTQHFRLGLDDRITKRNANILVIGGSGAGKSRFYVKPNLLQANVSYVITDPKKELLRSTGAFLKSQGYKIKVLDLIHCGTSFGYNPFNYLQEDEDVLRLIVCLVSVTTDKQAPKGEPFWEAAEIMLLQALMLYLFHEAPAEEQNFAMLLELLRSIQVREEDENYLSPVDILFLELSSEKPDHIALRLWQQYKQCAGKTAKSILISAAARLQRFVLPQVERLTSVDELELGRIGEEKTALFACIPDTDTSLNFLVSMLYTQLFRTLGTMADHKYGGRLPIPVHFLLDEFANVAQPQDFEGDDKYGIVKEPKRHDRAR